MHFPLSSLTNAFIEVPYGNTEPSKLWIEVKAPKVKAPTFFSLRTEREVVAFLWRPYLVKDLSPVKEEHVVFPA